MKRILIVFLPVVFTLFVQGQNYYFPPLSPADTSWERVTLASLGWCADKLDSVFQYLGEKNTKAFLIVKGGRIAAEKYFGTFVRDSLWYWASAAKSFTAFNFGIAQEEGYLHIEDTVSKWLGAGWTVCPPDKELLIKVRHQLTMTTGLLDDDPESDCTIDTCLKYLADAGTRWAYYNPPYLLIPDVIAAATGVSYQQFSGTHAESKTGMTGFWYDGHYISKARDMARFGILILNHGMWSQDTLLHDTAYFHAMVNTSQSFNLSYGYLWWLNGKGSFMVPGSQFVFPFNLIPAAPPDLFAAMGKNGQYLYIVPSMDLAVVRMGNDPGDSPFGNASFSNELWTKLMKVFCGTGGIRDEGAGSSVKIYPVPATAILHITFSSAQHGVIFELTSFEGKIIYTSAGSGTAFSIPVAGMRNGVYLLRILTNDKVITRKVLISH